MKEQSIRYKNLISCAKTFEYYASILEEPRKQYWIEQANNKRLEAESLPDNYVDPEWRMPEWGTYGT